MPAIFAIQLLNTLLASSAVADSEEAWFQEIPVIASATRMSQSQLEAPHTITIIDRDMIEASGAVEIAELLRLAPGFQIGQGDTPFYSVTYHGQTDSFSRRIQVMVDGRPVYGPIYNNVDWHALGIDMDDIHHIEVVRGPSAATFGENAFSAAINIITLQPFETRGWHVKAVRGSMDTSKGYLRYGGSHDDIDFRTSLGFDQGEAFHNNNSEKIVRSANMRLNYTPDSRNHFELHAGLSDGPFGRGAGAIEGDPGDPFEPYDPYQSRSIHRNYQLFRWVRQQANGGEMRLQFYHSYFAEDDAFSVGLLSGLPGVTPSIISTFGDQEIDFGVFNYKSDRLDAEVQYKSPQLGMMRYVVGLGGRYDRTRSDYLLGPKNTRKEERLARGFFNIEYRPVSDLFLNGGLMVEHGDFASTEISPRLGVNYLFSDDRAVRASVSRSMRAPSFLEEFWDLGIRTNDGTMLDYIHTTLPGGVDAESITAYELGYFMTWPGSGITLDMKLFREIIRDEINDRWDFGFAEPVSLITPGAWVGFNGSRIDTDGFELQMRYQPDQNTLASLQYAYADVDQMLDPDSLKLFFVSHDGTPKHTAGLLLSRILPRGWAISSQIYHMSEMSWYGDGGDVDEHIRVDLRLAKNFGAKRNKGKLEFIVHNLGGKHEVFDIDQLFETRYYLRGTLDLN